MLELSDRDAPKVTITPGTSSKDGWKTWSYCEDYSSQVGKNIGYKLDYIL